MSRYWAAWLPVLVAVAVVTVRGIDRIADVPVLETAVPVVEGPEIRVSDLGAAAPAPAEHVARRVRESAAESTRPSSAAARSVVFEAEHDAAPVGTQGPDGPSAVGADGVDGTGAEDGMDGGSTAVAAADSPEPADTLEATLRQRRDRAVLLARQERFDEAIPALRRLHEEAPADRRTREDLVAVLHWAGRDHESMEVGRGLVGEPMEPYAAEALARAARNTGRADDAVALYRSVLAEDAGRVESRIGLVLSLLETGEVEEARRRAAELVEDHPDLPDALLAAAHVHHATGETLEAAVLLRRILEVDPDHGEARRLEVLRLAELGAPFLAARRAAEDPSVLRPEDRAYVSAEQAASAVRWIEVPPRDPDDPAARHAATDRALDLLESALADLPEDAGFAGRRLRFDRILALRERHRMDEVIAEIEALEREGTEIAPYVLRAGADAYLYEREPERAEELYVRALETWPGDPVNLEARLGLFHALVQQNDFDAAFRVVDSLVAELPEWKHPPAPRLPVENPDRLDAEVAAALGRGFAGDLPEAQARLETLADRAPMNASVRQELASVYLWRGWPRRAERELDLTLAVAPDHVGSLVGKAAVHLELEELGAADEVLDSLEVVAPENEHVRRLREREEAATAWELAVDGSAARSSGGELGTRDRGVETTLRTPPLLDGLRAFATTYFSDASFADGPARHDRIGAGVEFATRPVSLRVAMDAGRTPPGRIGISVDGELRFDDRHTARLSFQSRSRRAPLQAVLHDVDAWSARAAIERRWSERRRAVLELDWLEMDDGNRRRSAYAALEQRLLTTPRLRLTGLGEVYGELNTRDDAPYYNPPSSVAPALGAVGEWTTWSRYERSFVQRLGLTGGLAWQEGFETRPVAAIRYEHDWTLSPRLDLRYGVRWARPVYDGAPERRLQLHGGFEWRIR